MTTFDASLAAISVNGDDTMRWNVQPRLADGHRVFLRAFFVLRFPFENSTVWSGRRDPIRLIAVRVLIPCTAPASARERNHNCLRRLDGREDLGKRGSFFAA